MDSGYYFISYSRHDFYITESLSQQLRKKKIPYWFDVEQLQPGTDWEISIEAGVKNAKGLILITSQKSLLSPYVAKEWIQAWLSKKPIYLVVIEEISYEAIEHKFFENDDKSFKASMLPEIAHSVIDFRANFQSSSHKLTKVLTENSASIKDTIHPQNRFHIPRKSPLIIYLIIFTLFLFWLLTLLATFYTLIIHVTTFLLGCYFSYEFARFILKFLQRETSYQQLIWMLLLTPIFLFLFAPMDYLISFSIIFISLITLSFMHLSRKNLLHWLPKGYAPAFLRHGVRLSIRGWRLRNLKYNGLNFKLYYHPSDSLSANPVRSALKNVGHREITQEDARVDVHIILISHLIDWTQYLPLANSDAKVVCVLLGRIKQHELMKTFQTRQWVDYRTRNKGVLQRLALSLLPEKNNEIARDAIDLTIPENFESLILPPSIHRISFFLYLLGLSSFFLASGSLSVSFNSDIDNAIVRLITVALLVALPAYFSFSLIQTNILIANRELTFRQFLVYRLLPIGTIIFSLGIVTSNPVILGALLVFLGISYFSLRHWLILTPLSTKPILSGFKSNLGYWKDHIVRFTLVLLSVATLISGTKPFDTAALDLNRPDEIVFQEIMLGENLTVRLPEQWYTSFVRNEIEQTVFNTETTDISILSSLTSRAHPNSTLESFYEMFARYQRLNVMVKPLWVTIYDPSQVNLDVFIAVWSIEDGYARDRVAQHYVDNLDTPIMLQANGYDLIEVRSNNQKLNQFYITDEYVIIISAFEGDLLGMDVVIQPFLSAFGIETSG